MKKIVLFLSVCIFCISVNAQVFAPVKKVINVPGLSAKQIIAAINVMHEKTNLELSMSTFNYVKVDYYANTATSVYDCELYKDVFQFYSEIPLSVYAYDNKCVLSVNIVKMWFSGSSDGKGYTNKEHTYIDGRGLKETNDAINYLFAETEKYLNIVSKEVAL